MVKNMKYPFSSAITSQQNCTRIGIILGVRKIHNALAALAGHSLDLQKGDNLASQAICAKRFHSRHGLANSKGRLPSYCRPSF